MTFVHVAGHSGDRGNDRADELVQWGKTPGPHSRMCPQRGHGEGDGRDRRMSGHVTGTHQDSRLILGESSSDDDYGEVQELVELLEGCVPDGGPVGSLGEELGVELSNDSGSAVNSVGSDANDTGTILRALLHDSEGGELTADPDDPEIEDHAQVAVAAIDSIGLYRCETDNRAIQVSRPNE